MIRLRSQFSLNGCSALERVLLALIAVVIGYSIFVLAWSISQPLIEAHSFRQTQTALSTYWMLQGEPLIAYETPVKGAPWVIPFEFPVFQYSAALLALIGIPLDDAGRIAAFVYFLACAWPIGMIARSLRLGRFGTLALLALFFASPINLYWARAFMIESCALFFSLLCLAFLLRAGETRRIRDLVVAAGAGALGVLAKSTTLPAFSLLGGFYFLYLAYRKLVIEREISAIWFLSAFGIALIVPYIVGLSWVAYADSLKEQSVLGSALTSGALKKWNYGEFPLRFSEKLWIETLAQRTFPDILGFASAIGVGFCLAALTSLRLTIFVGFCVVAFLTPMMIFTNLHVHHNYYQTANSVFMLAAIAIALTALFEIGKKRAATLALAVILAGQISYFQVHYFQTVRNPPEFLTQWRIIAREARDLTPPDSALYFFGYSWSSVIPYYAERKSVALSKERGERLRNAFENPSTYLGGLELGAVVVCVPQPPEVQAYLSNRDVLSQYGRCQLLGPEQKPAERTEEPPTN